MKTFELTIEERDHLARGLRHLIIDWERSASTEDIYLEKLEELHTLLNKIETKIVRRNGYITRELLASAVQDWCLGGFDKYQFITWEEPE